MLNSIDSFFQYFVKRAFNLFCFSAKRMPYRMLICKCCFLSCSYIEISIRCECRGVPWFEICLHCRQWFFQRVLLEVLGEIVFNIL